MFRLKQRTLPWAFDIVHVPGRTNYAADTTSRHPSPNGAFEELSTKDMTEHVIAAAIRRETTSLLSITWETLVTETAKDPDMVVLQDAIQKGFPDESRTDLCQYWQYRHGLYESGGVSFTMTEP